MIRFLYKFFITLNSTSWIAVVYFLKEDLSLGQLPSMVSTFILLFIPIVLSIISLLIAMMLKNDNLNSCASVENSNNTYLPTYLGYFFVALSVPKWQHLIVIYLIVFIFVFVSSDQYFNPIYLLFGYKFYDVTTSQGIKIFIISKKTIRTIEELHFNKLKRINDTTFIDLGGKYGTSHSENQKST